MCPAAQSGQRSWLHLFCWSAVALLGAIAFVGDVQADASAVEALIARGVELRRAGDDVRALPLFKQAYDQAATPRTAAQLGLVEIQLGYHADADRHLREALSASDDFWIRKNAEALSAALTELQGKLAEIHIRGTPAGAEVLVNQRLVGRLPLDQPVRVGKGEVTIDVRAPGGKTARRSFFTTPGQSERVEFHLGEASVAEVAMKTAPPAAGPPALAARAETPAAAGGGSGRLGVFLRLDVAVYPESGQRLAPGLFYGISDRLTIGLAGLIGKLSQGAWLGARYGLIDGAVKPSLTVGVPVLVGNAGNQVGGQAAAGLTVDVAARVSLFADLGAAFFPGAPAGAGRLWVLPSLGVMGRL